MTPLDLACEKRNTSLIRLLRKKFTAPTLSAPPNSNIFAEDSSSNNSGRKSSKTPQPEEQDLMTPPAPQTQAMHPHNTEDRIYDILSNLNYLVFHPC